MIIRHDRSQRGSLLPVYAGIWFAVIAWGGSFVAARVLLNAGIAGKTALSPAILATLRFGIASLFFLIPLLKVIVRRQISARNLLRMAFLGQISFSLYFWLQYTGVQQTNASISSILVVGLIPVVTAFLAQVIGGEKFSPLRLAALLLGFCGVVLIVLQKPIAVSLRSGFLFGAVCLVSNAFAFAIYSNLSKRWMQGISPLVMTGGTMMSGALGLLLLSLVDPVNNRWDAVVRLSAIQWGALFFLAVVCSVVAYFVYNFALTKIEASRVAVYIYFEPVVTVLLGVSLLSERLSWQTLVGAAVIAASVLIVNLLTG
ncbi:MAG TPA: EamA family transporter [Ktedonosporobacter sp.]|jgi:drug/metabolite transporter (DMT)-like permease|nr:EamA family transporter [Ktedonosporobacter sp.]